MKTKKTNTEIIQSLLDDIDATAWLRINVAGILKHPAMLDIHDNQIINALRIGIHLRNDYLNVGNTASMQSGKSGTVFFLCNYVLPSMGFLMPFEHALFVTSLFDQNRIITPLH